MQLSEIRTRLSDVYGSTLTSDTSFYDRIINDAYRKLCALQDWWWLETYEVLRFNAPMATAHDFLCTAGVAVMSASGTCMISTAYNYGWCFTGNNTYRVTSVNAAASTVTIDALFLEDSSAYSLTFWNDTLTLPSAFDHVVQIAPRKDPNYRPLRQVDLEHIEQMGPNLEGYEDSIGVCYAIFRESSIDIDQARIRIFPPPYETAEYAMRYIQNPSVLSADADSPLLPTKFHSVLVDMARLELLKATGAPDDETASWETEIAKGVNQIVRDQHRKGNKLMQFGRWGAQHGNVLPFRMTNYTVGTDTD